MGGKTIVPEILEIVEVEKESAENGEVYANNIRNLLATILFEYSKKTDKSEI